MYKAHLSLLFLFFLSVFNLSFAFSFPSTFVASIVRNDSVSDNTNSLVVSMDLPNQQAYIILGTQYEYPSEYWLVYSPKDAPPGSAQERNYVEFRREAYDGKYYCQYTTNSYRARGLPTNYPPREFPYHWIVGLGFKLSSYFDTSDLFYGGRSTWNGNPVDTWISHEKCKIISEEPLPCVTLATQIGSNIPIGSYIGYERRPGSFDSSWIVFDSYKMFKQVQPEIQIPDSWPTNCYNAENGFSISTWGVFLSVSTGADNFTLSLTGRPVPALGPAVLRFQIVGGCTTCLNFTLPDGSSADGYEFNLDNWNIPILVLLTYVADGESTFIFGATGGGYDIPFIDGGGSLNNQTSAEPSKVILCKNGVPGRACQ